MENIFSKFFGQKKPVIKENTFLLWEPCSKSHSEVIPGYAKYLRDLGYHVSVLLTPERYKEGLFSRYKDENISLNKLSQKDIKKFILNSDLSDVKGVLVTTSGKLCDEIHFDECFEHFNPKVDPKRLFFVSHDCKNAADNGSWRESLITLRELNYKGVKSVVVNPHYFGEIEITPKNEDVVNFITIGANH